MDAQPLSPLKSSRNPGEQPATQFRKQSRRDLLLSPGGETLKVVGHEALKITRQRSGKGFTYFDEHGRRITDAAILERIRSLAIPPAYRDVSIAADPNAHIQAIGRDEAGRLQYRYHPDWTEVREDRKAEQLGRLVEVLPRIRASVIRDLASRRLDRDKAAACAVALIDDSYIRIGSEAYARDHGSHGAATLLKRHVQVNGSRITLRFPGKSSKEVDCTIVNPRLARAIKRVGSLRGRRLLQWIGPSREILPISADDVNAYLSRAAGTSVTAKDLRMLGATVSAAEALAEVEPGRSQTVRKRQLAQVMRAVARRLSNTPAVVRKSYVHRLVVQSFQTGTLAKTYRRARGTCHRRRCEIVVGQLVTRRKP